jgi:hypothetical protein
MPAIACNYVKRLGHEWRKYMCSFKQWHFKMRLLDNISNKLKNMVCIVILRDWHENFKIYSDSCIIFLYSDISHYFDPPSMRTAKILGTFYEGFIPQSIL